MAVANRTPLDALAARRLPATSRATAHPSIALVLVCGMATTWAVIFGWLAVQRFAVGGAHAEDLGFTDQVLSNFLRGQWFRTSIYQGAAWNTELDVTRLARPDSLFAFHFEPLLLAVLPLYALGGGVTVLLVGQAAAMAMGAVVAFRIARHGTDSATAALAVALAYLLSPLGQWAVLDDFHTTALAAPLLLLCVERLVVARQARQAFAAAVLAAGAREEVGLVVATLGLVLCRRSAYRHTGLALITIGLASSVIGGFVIRAYSGTATPFDARYAATLGSGLAATLGALGRPAVQGYAAVVALSGGWLALLAPLAFLPAMPILAMNALSTSPWMMAGRAHYSALVLPFVVLAAAAALRRCQPSKWLMAAASGSLVLTSTLAYAAEGSGPLARNYVPGEITPHVVLLTELASRLPIDASVSASTALVPRLTARAHVYVFPALNNADYVFVDLTSTPAPTSAGDVFLRTRALLEQGGWQVEAARDGLLLMHRLDAAGPSDPDAVADELLPWRALPTSAPAMPQGTYSDGRVSLLSAALVASPDATLDVDGPRWILRTTWRADAPVPPGTRLVYLITLRDGSQRQIWDSTDLWWYPPSNWHVGQTVTIDVPDIPVRQFDSWQASFEQAEPWTG